jgi:hypothetical protein
VLTGWLVLIDSELKFVRVFSALIVSTTYLVLLLIAKPYKSVMDFYLAAGVQVVTVMIFMGGLVVGLHNDISTDAAGSPELATRFLGLSSSDDIVIIMICVCFAILTLVFATLGLEMRLQRIKHYLDSKWSVITMDPPCVKWTTRAIYACFLSHYKMGKHDPFRTTAWLSLD